MSRYDGKRFTSFTTEDGLPHNTVTSILEDRLGNLWFGTQGGGVGRYDGHHFTSFTTEDGLPYNSVFSILEDRDGDLWFGTASLDIDEGSGVGRYDGERFTSVAVGAGPLAGPGNRVLGMLQDRSGDLWFATMNGVVRYDKKEFRRYTTELPSDLVVCVREDHQGNLWFGTWGGGASRFDGKAFTTFTTADGLAHSQVVFLMPDRLGHMWFSTWGGGISRYDGQVFQNLLQQDGLGHNTVWGMVEDRHGDVWIATEGGVTRYHPTPASPPVQVAVVADRRYWSGEDVHVSTSQGYVAFEFQGVSAKTRAGQLAYLYRLEGYDREWRQTRGHRVEYTALPRGDYVFQVRAVDRDLGRSESAAQVRLEVHLPYAQIGAVLSLVLAVALIAWQGGRIVQRDQRLRESNAALLGANQELREKTAALDESNRELQGKTRQLERANQEVLQADKAKSAFLANMSHEIRTPMHAVVNFSSMIQEGVYGGINPELRDAVEEISRNGEHLLELINDILDYSKIEAGAMNLQLGECVPELCIENAISSLEYKAQEKGLQVLREIEPGLPVLRADERRITQHVLVNLLKNAIKFTPRGVIRVGARRQDRQVLFWVADTGIGIPVEHHERVFETFHQVDGSASREAEGTGLGLAIARRFVDMHGGRIWVESAAGEGATFYFSLPVGEHGGG